MWACTPVLTHQSTFGLLPSAQPPISSAWCSSKAPIIDCYLWVLTSRSASRHSQGLSF
jgi:hypothetical protein